MENKKRFPIGVLDKRPKIGDRFLFLLVMKSGIYQILLKTGVGNTLLYIGQSMDIESRFKCHEEGLKRGRHFNRYLQNVYNKYGGHNFIYEIVCECRPSELDAIETENRDKIRPKWHKWVYGMERGAQYA